MGTAIVNYNIPKNQQQDNYAYAGKPGLGTVALVSPVQIDDWGIDDNLMIPSAPASENIVTMHGLRSIRGPNIATNTISAAHHQVTDGFMINYPGLRDGGTFDFEANFNPDEIPWQDMHNDMGFPAKSVMQSPIFLHKDHSETTKNYGLPMLQMIVMPASMKHLWYMRGFIAMMGPVTYEMEDIVKATISFKISGKPFLSTAMSENDETKPRILRRRYLDGEEQVEWYVEGNTTILQPTGTHDDFYSAYWLGGEV